MKHFTFSLVLLLISYAASAGTSNLISQDSVVLTNDFGLNQTKYAYQFDANGNKVLEINYQWNPATEIWIVMSRLEKKYNENGLIKEEIVFTWNMDTQTWYQSALGIFQYDDNSNNTLNLQYVWDSVINEWVENYKYEMAYDERNNQINLTHFVWDAENEWKASTNSANNHASYGAPVYDFVIYNKVSCLCE